MKKIFIQRISMLGMILIGVSAVTAAVLPSDEKYDANQCDQPGSLTASNDGCMISCTPTGNINVSSMCNATVESGETSIEEGSLSNCTTIGDC